MDVSIVIPIYNALPVAKQCLASIVEHRSSLSFEIIFVDNGSQPDVEAWLLQQEAHHPNLRHLRYPAPLGFARAVNVGAAQATGEVFIVLNSDTIVTAGWMDGLHHALQDDPSLGALTPCTNHSGEPAQMDFGTVGLPATKALAIRNARHVAPEILYLPQRLTFFCVALRRQVWFEFNGLDEAYPIGNFEDDDLCLRLRVAGYRLGVALHVFLYHHNNATFTANRIHHQTLMTTNARIFAERARAFAEAPGTPTPRWPRRSQPDVSVVILPRAGASLERTLQSLANQTILDFEIVLPESSTNPTRTWLAYIHQGDILYPFHLEALLDALIRNGAEAGFSDGWIAGETFATTHPDAEKLIRSAPSLLAGWMHHASISRDLLWEQSVPFHWPRTTWEMQQRPTLASYPPQKPDRSVTNIARQTYRRIVPFETRLSIDAALRKLLRRPAPDPIETPFRELTAQLNERLAAGIGAGQFATACSLPAVIAFNSVPWNSLIQRQHHFVRGLAERGHPVFWVDTALAPPRRWNASRRLQSIAPGAHLIRLPGSARDIYTMPWSPAVLEAMTAGMAQVASDYGIRSAVTLINYQRWQPLAMHLRERFGWKIVYDCLDDQRAMADVYQIPYSTYEDLLIAGADRLVTSSAVLQQRLPRPSLLLHNATDYDLFSSAVSAGYLQDLPRPLIGFFGALADWLDTDLIHAAAARRPDWTFVYIGPHTFSKSSKEVEWLRATDLPNIHVLPQMDHLQLAAHLAEFDVCTMPFLDIPVTRTMNAVKLYEYLSAGKAAVCRDLPEIRHLLADEPNPDELILLYKTPEQFIECLQQALTKDTPERAERRRQFAKRNDWSQRVDMLSRKIIEVA
jgi:GT2 family glycosyltransferase/glycosyltransferase involved in cell wall biosynthesis